MFPYKLVFFYVDYKYKKVATAGQSFNIQSLGKMNKYFVLLSFVYIFVEMFKFIISFQE